MVSLNKNIKYTLGEYWTADKSIAKAITLATEAQRKHEFLMLVAICTEIYNGLSDADKKYVYILEECLTPKECCIDFLKNL